MHPLLSFYLRTAAIVVGSIAVLLGAPILFLAFVAGGLGGAMCGNDLLYNVPSPSGHLKAVVFERDCGATTDFSTQVSILSPRESLSTDGGNVLAADSDHGQAPAGPGGGPVIRITWLSDHQLRIEHHPFARLFKAERFHSGVSIDYVPVKSNG